MSTLAEEIQALMALGHDLNTATQLAERDRTRRFSTTQPGIPMMPDGWRKNINFIL